jgi:putative transposase
VPLRRKRRRGINRLITVHGAPRYLRSGNGPEFVSLALLQWVKDERLESVLSEPGKPWQNGTNESFNGKFRDECDVPPFSVALGFGVRGLI